MIAYRDNIYIRDIKILSSTTERSITGRTTITGTCMVTPDEFGEEGIPMEFSYIGKLNEPSSKLLDYLKAKGESLWAEKLRREQETLGDLIERYYTEEI